MKVITTRILNLIDASKMRLPRDIIVPLSAGEHEVEIIPNPYPRAEGDFWVLSGTMIGAVDTFWQAAL